jgi:MFS family permease
MAKHGIRGMLHRFGLTGEVLAISFARMGDAVGNGILLVILPLYVARMHVAWLDVSEPVRVGIVLALYGVASAIAQPFVGALGDRTGRYKLIIILGLLLLGLSTLAIVPIHTYELLLLVRVLQGIGLAGAIPTSVALLTLGSRQESRGRAMGFYTTLRVVGLSLGPLIGGGLHDWLGFNAAFYASGAAALLGVILVWFWVQEKQEKADQEQEQRSFQALGQRFFNVGILALGFATFVMAGSFSMMVTLEKQYAHRLHQGAFAFGTAISALMFSRIVLQMPLGWLSDRIGRRWPIIVGLLIMIPATIWLGLAPDTLQLALARVLQGVGSAAIAAPAFAAAGDLSKKGGRGRQLSVLTIGFGLGVAVGPLITGLLVLFFFMLPFLVYAGLLLAGAVVVYFFVPETAGKNAEKRNE